MVFSGTDKVQLIKPDFKGATLKDVVFSGTVEVSEADLRGATLDGVVFDGPVVFTRTTVGQDDSGQCTSISNTNFGSIRFHIEQVGSGCGETPLFPGSTVQPVSVDPADWAAVNWQNAVVVTEGEDYDYLKGADLSNIILKGTAMWGAPLDFTGTTFTGGNLNQAKILAADFSGAEMTGITAYGATFTGSVFTHASLGGANTDLSHADFVNTDLGHGSFTSANIEDADFSYARAANTDFGSTRATGAAFAGTHILGNPEAFQNAVLQNADFTKALLGGEAGVTGGVNFNSSHLTLARFDYAQCIGCDFSQAQLDDATFVAAYLPGAIFSAANLTGAHLLNAYTTTNTTEETWTFELAFGEPPFSVRYEKTDWTGADTTGVTICPNGQGPDPSTGCKEEMSQEDPSRTPIPPACSPSGENSCEKEFKTLTGNGTAGSGNNQVSSPADVIVGENITTFFFCDTGNHIVRKISGSSVEAFAGNGTSGDSGDGGDARDASFREPVGLALGPDGSVYIADRGANRVRVVAPDLKIYAVAGDGEACEDSQYQCGDGGDATSAQLSAPSGVWVDPLGECLHRR